MSCYLCLPERTKGEGVGSTTQSSTCWSVSQDRRIWPHTPIALTGQTYKHELCAYVHISVCMELVFTIFCCLLSWSLYCLSHIRPLSWFCLSDREVAEGRAAESVRASSISRKEVQWSWSCIWLCALARRCHMEVSHINLFPVTFLWTIFKNSLLIPLIVCYFLFF